MRRCTLPAGLAGLRDDRWVGTRLEERDGKLAKVPYRPDPARLVKARANDPATWGTFAQAAAGVNAGAFDLVGYELLAADTITFVDLDHQRDPETGAATPRARAIIAALDSYTEPSQSGTGFHILFRGTVPPDLLGEGRQGKKAGDFELYTGGRFAAMTLAPLPGLGQLRDVGEDAIRVAWDNLFPAPAEPERPAAPPPSRPVDLDDAALLDKAFASKGGDDFRRQHEGTYLNPDKSSDDFAYLGRLAFWTQRDPHRMRRIAEASGRRRPKWDGRRGDTDWLGYSIANIVAENGDVYDPGRPPPGAVSPAVGASPPPQGGHRCPNCDHWEAEARRERAEKERYARLLAVEQEEGARAVERGDYQQTRADALEAVIRYPNQAQSVGLLDFLEGAARSYRRGAALTIAGRDFARTTCKASASRRSESTVRRGVRTTLGLADGDPLPYEPVPFGHAGGSAIVYRDEVVEGEEFRGPVPVPNVYLEPELRDNPYKAVLRLLPPPPKKTHGGDRRTIPVPAEVAAQPDPVRRRREHVTHWYNALTDDKIVTEHEHIATDYWTSQGEQRFIEEIERERVARGYAPPKAPAYRPTQAPLPPTRPPSRQDDGRPTNDLSRQDDAIAPDVPGQCQDADCERAAVTAGYCLEHWQEQGERYRRQAPLYEAAGAG